MAIDEAKAKKIAMDFIGQYNSINDNVSAVLQEKIWHVVLYLENSKQVEVLIDDSNGKILGCVSLDAHMNTKPSLASGTGACKIKT